MIQGEQTFFIYVSVFFELASGLQPHLTQLSSNTQFRARKAASSAHCEHASKLVEGTLTISYGQARFGQREKPRVPPQLPCRPWSRARRLKI